ncbi:MAG TPA: cytochrome C oxidase subunit IV family protein [Bryobacteraceae bacterium]|nr:cytochrome C oxidase subunit IV family protein [Bryobacteraceae bacterium]
MSHEAEEAVAAVGVTTKTFLNVWIALLAITGLEVFLTYEQLPVLIMLTALLGLSVIKAMLIIGYFMHLKFERFSLFLSLFPILIMCIILMLLLFLPDSMRLVHMRLAR